MPDNSIDYRREGVISFRGIAFALATSVMFGLGAVFAKIASDDLSPLFIAFLDLSVGFVLILPLIAVTRTNILVSIGKRSLVDLFLVSTVGTALPLFLVIWGLKHTTAIQGGILIQLQTAMGVFFAVLLLHERLKPWQMLGIVAMFLGGILTVLNTSSEPFSQIGLVGPAMVILGATGFGYAFVPLKRLARVADPFQVAGLRLLIGALVLAPFLLAFPSSLPTTAPPTRTLIIVGVYILTNFSLAFFTVNKALSLLPAWQTAAILQTMPVFSTVGALTLADETLTIWHIAGAALIICGGVIITRTQRE